MGHALAIGRRGGLARAFALLLRRGTAFGGTTLHPALGLRGLTIFRPVRLAGALLALPVLHTLHPVLALGRLSGFMDVGAPFCLRLAGAMVLLAGLAGLLFLDRRLLALRLALTLTRC